MQYIWFTTVSVVSELSLPQMLIQVVSASVLYVYSMNMVLFAMEHELINKHLWF